MKSGNGRREEEDRPDGRRPTEPGSDQEDNIVQLPRDWLGPREELVPFGPSADPDPSRAAQADEVSPEDFWGERSAAVQDTLEHEAAPGSALGRVPVRVRLKRLRRPVIAAGVAALVAGAVAVPLALINQAGGLRHSTVASTLRPYRHRTMSPAHLGARRSASNQRTRSSRPTKPSRYAHVTHTAPVAYTAQPTAAAASSASVYVGSQTPSTGTPSTSVPATSPTTTSPSTTPTTVGSKRKSSTPPFGARGALGPGKSPTR
jgi:hypothetical protein